MLFLRSIHRYFRLLGQRDFRGDVRVYVCVSECSNFFSTKQYENVCRKNWLSWALNVASTFRNRRLWPNTRRAAFITPMCILKTISEKKAKNFSRQCRDAPVSSNIHNFEGKCRNCFLFLRLRNFSVLTQWTRIKWLAQSNGTLV